MSNLYLLKDGSLTMNPKRTFNSTPLVKLGDEHFARVRGRRPLHRSCGQVDAFLRRFDTIPDLLELDHLTVTGDVTFGSKVSLKVRARGVWHAMTAAAGHGDCGGESRRPDRHSERQRAGEQDHLRQPAHPRPLGRACISQHRQQLLLW